MNFGTQMEPWNVLVSAILPTTFQLQVKNLLVDYKDVFVWSYKESKGIPREICDHKTQLMVDAQPIKQRQYKMNLNYALKVREDLDKLLDVGFIYPIETTQWLSLLVIVPKKNGKLWICVNYHKLNAQTKKDLFQLPFLDSSSRFYGWTWNVFFYGWL